MIHIAEEMPERMIAEGTNRLLSVDEGYLSKRNTVSDYGFIAIADQCAEEVVSSFNK